MVKYKIDADGWFHRPLFPAEYYKTDFPALGCFVEQGQFYTKHPDLDPIAIAREEKGLL